MRLLVSVGLVVLTSTLGCSKGKKDRPPGVMTAFKPVASFARLRRDCGPGCKVLKLVAKNVSSDGTMDLTKDALVTIEFKKPKGSAKAKDNTKAKKSKRPKNETKAQKKKRIKAEKAAKKAAKKAEKSKGEYLRQIVTIPKIGGSRKQDKIVMGFSSRPYNVPSTHATTVVEPKCTMLELWTVAREKGANPDELARVEYDRDGYLFELKSFKMAFDLQCRPRWAPADPKSLRPVESFAGAASVAPKDAKFSEVVAREVRPDGTANTSTDEAWVRYKFFWTEPLKRTEEIQVWLRDGELRKTRSFMTLDSKPTAIAPPNCKFSELWAVALEAGADKDKSATITYDSSGYHFRQAEPVFSVRFRADCKLKK